MAAIGPARVFAVGVAWFVTNPKAVVLSLTAGLVVGDSDPSVADMIGTDTAYVVFAGSTTVLPIAVTAALGHRAEPILAATSGSSYSVARSPSSSSS